LKKKQQPELHKKLTGSNKLTSHLSLREKKVMRKKAKEKNKRAKSDKRLSTIYFVHHETTMVFQKIKVRNTKDHTGTGT